MRRALLTLGCLAACKDKPAPPPPPAPPHDGVKLIQPGAAPLQAVRYHFTKGTRTASALLCDVAIKIEGQGDATPTLAVELDTVVDDVLADGSAKLRFTLTRAQLRDLPSGAAPSDLQAEVAALQGAVITELLAPDGKSAGAHVEASGAAPDRPRAQLDSLIESLEHVATQLPAEPIGVGATWEERRTLPPGGISGVSQTIYTVTSLSAAAFAYTSAGVLTGQPQTIERDGVKVEVASAGGHSQATGRVELARYALDVDVRSVFTTTMTAIAPKDTPGAGSSTVEITMATRMTPVDVAAPSGADAAPTDAGAAPSGSAAAPSGSAAAPSDAAAAPSDAGAGPDHGAHSAP